MDYPCPFFILDTVESTNFYAISQVKNSGVVPGSAWYSPNQTAGRGQRGRNWVSEPGMGISLSVAIAPQLPFEPSKFHFSSLVALSCFQFLKDFFPEGLSVKWPNDLYLNDRKAGGILIENLISGSDWRWAIVGIGINVNQTAFPDQLNHAVSMKMVSGIHYDPEQLARALHIRLLKSLQNPPEMESIMQAYNEVLYKKEEEVVLQQNGHFFRCRIRGVNENGQLLTDGDGPGVFRVGDVSWI